MSSIGTVTPWTTLPATATLAADPADSSSQYPAGAVQVERSGAKLFSNISGAVLGIGGAALLGMSLLTHPASGAIASRPLASALGIGGAMVGGGVLATIIGASLPPATKAAAATGIPTQAAAGTVAGESRFAGHEMEVVRTTDGSWAVIDHGVPAPRSSGGSSSHSHHSGGGYDPDPYYPSGGYGGSTGSGDSGGSSYDPPSYDPPSYDPPSSDYGNSSSNGNPSESDF